ncbi:MAG: class I SAM-dependent methyltransferase [Desulfobacterales bacterium]|nr:class I SAM-dependent methyltransferase [Desulfobacterales bacterium]
MTKNSKLNFFDSGIQTEASKPGDKWPISNFLKQNKAKWAEVLKYIYKHPMSFPGSVSPYTGELLRALILNIAPKNVMEVGSFLGASSIWIASAMAEYERANKLYCIDLFSPHKNNPWCPGVELKNPLNFMLDNIKKCSFDNFISVHQGDSKKLIPIITKKIDVSLDFAIIDGDHSVSGCLADFTLIEPFVTTGGYILFHDMYPDYCGVDGPAFTLLEKIAPFREKFEVCHIYTTPLNFGYALVRKIRE